MPGQGLIIATGALDYPAEYRSMAPRTLSLLGISKVMTVTSTYDHRIIQGAESGLFLVPHGGAAQGRGRLLRADLRRPEGAAPPGALGDRHRARRCSAPAGSDEVIEKQASVLQLIHAYRVRGHLVADLDPLDSKRAPHKDLDPATYGLTLWDLDREFITNGLSGKDKATLREILEVLRDTYCGTIGVEYMYIADPERKEWLQDRMESTRNQPALDTAAARRILEKLVEAESFERFLHAKYIGHKRFSLEGCEATIPLLDRVLNDAAQRRREGGRDRDGAPRPPQRAGQHHRQAAGADLLGVRAANPDPLATQGSGDVKYHLGASGVHEAPSGHDADRERGAQSQPPGVGEPRGGRAWSAPSRTNGGDRERARDIPLLLHGDAAFAGQGIVAETLNLAQLEGYTTGGTIHVVINNQIGFTTSPEDARSSTYCTDVAKMVHAPVFHVNGDDPEAVDHVAASPSSTGSASSATWSSTSSATAAGATTRATSRATRSRIMYAKIKSHTSGGRALRRAARARGA